MREYTLHVPIRTNIGQKVSRDFFARLEERLSAIAGGFTRTRAIGGYHMSDGTLKREPVYVYSVVTDHPQEQCLRSIAGHVKISLAQESVLLTSRAIDSELIT